MEEIIEHIYYEIKNSGFEKKLIAGIVLTGGGSQLKHISQLVEFVTGMDSRIGYPTEHLAKGNEDVTSPSFATGIGLVLKGFQYHEKQMAKSGKVKTHSGKIKGGFFDKIFTKSKEWFEDDSER